MFQDDSGAGLQAGAPISAQNFSGLAPFMVPDSFTRLRMAMMQAPSVQQPQTAPPAEYGVMGFGG